MMAVEHQGQATCFKGLPEEQSGATALTTNGDDDSHRINAEPVNKQLRLDFRIMNDGTIQVKEDDANSCSQNNEALDAIQHNQFPKDAQVSGVNILPQQSEEQAKLPNDIPLRIFPQSQDMHLVTTSSMLSTDITTFSTQVPSILTEGDEEDTDTQGNLTEQFHVVTTTNMLSQSGGNLVAQTAPMDVIATQSDFERTAVLQAPQQVLLTGIIVEGTNVDQSVPIGLPSIPENSANDAEEVEGGHACPHADCNTVCSKAHKLKLHMLTHSGERAYKCPMEGCGWSFATSYKLKRHLRGHTGERPFACDFEGCGKHFTTAYNLKAHVRVHYQTNTILCTRDGCNQAFPTLHKLHVHERKHQLEDRPFTCQVEGCARVFTSASALTTHIRTHSVDRAHVCDVTGCGKTFTKASKLKLHMRSHTGERPFGCEVPGCAWTFTSGYKLKRHMRKHTGERPFTCHFPSCTKSFTRSSHLKTHLRVHTGERPHACPVEGCSKSFTAGSTLSVHMRKHTGEKPFKCDVEGCSKAYTTAANLRAHKKRHEGQDVSNQVGDNASEAELVSSGAMLSESEAEVTYTTIQTFSEDFGSDVAPLPVGCVQFTPSSSALCALVASADNPLISSTADSQGNIHVRVRPTGQLDDGGGEGVVSETVHLPLHTGEQFVNVSLEDGTRIDVTEFVVRSDENEAVMNRTRHRSEDSDTSGATPKMAGCGFDLSISSMMRHLRGEALEGVVRPKEHVESPVAVPLDLRTAVRPEDQFAPPAVIFQDEILKTPEQENDSTVVPRSPETPTRVSSQQTLRISMPHDALQAHLPQTLEPAMAADLDKISGHHPLSTSELTFGSPPETHDEHELCKDGLPAYIDNPSSSEQEETSGDTYPESTINLQDLRYELNLRGSESRIRPGDTTGGSDRPDRKFSLARSGGAQ